MAREVNASTQNRITGLSTTAAVQKNKCLTTGHPQSYLGSWEVGQRVSLAMVQWGKARRSCQLLRLCEKLPQPLDAVIAGVECVG